MCWPMSKCISKHKTSPLSVLQTQTWRNGPVASSLSIYTKHGCSSGVFWKVLFHGKVSCRKGQGTPVCLGHISTTSLTATNESLQDTCLRTLTQKSWMPVGLRPLVLTSREVRHSDLICSRSVRRLHASYICIQQKTVGNKRSSSPQTFALFPRLKKEPVEKAVGGTEFLAESRVFLCSAVQHCSSLKKKAYNHLCNLPSFLVQGHFVSQSLQDQGLGGELGGDSQRTPTCF